MRKIFANLKSVVAFAVVAAMTLSVSCMYDDTALTKRVNKVENDLAALTEKVNGLAGQEVTLDSLLAGNLVITGVTTDAAGNTVVSLSNGESFTVLAEAKTLQYRTENGVLEISADGEKWVAVTADAACLVKEVRTNADGTITIVFANGTEFTSTVAELIECAATRAQVYVRPGESKGVRFTINDAVEDINVMNQPFGWSATVEEYVEVEDDDFGGGMMPLAVGGKDYVLNITGPAKKLVAEGLAATEGVVSVHFNTAAGACKVMNVAVNIAEITLTVNKDTFTLTNSIVTTESNPMTGMVVTDFANFYIGYMTKAEWEEFGIEAAPSNYTYRNSGFSNVLQPLSCFEEGVCEIEEYTFTAEQFLKMSYDWEFEVGGEYVIFVTPDYDVNYEPDLSSAVVVDYKSILMSAVVDESSITAFDAAVTYSLSGYNYFLVCCAPVADIEEMIAEGFVADYAGFYEYFLTPRWDPGFNMYAGAAIPSVIDTKFTFAELNGMSMTGANIELNANTEYHLFVFPFNESDAMNPNFAAKGSDVYGFGTFTTAPLSVGTFDPAPEYTINQFNEELINVSVDFSEDVVKAAYAWFDSPVADQETREQYIITEEFMYTFDEYTTGLDEAYTGAYKFDAEVLPNPIYLGIIAVNANGEYVYCEKEFTYVAPEPEYTYNFNVATNIQDNTWKFSNDAGEYIQIPFYTELTVADYKPAYWDGAEEYGYDVNNVKITYNGAETWLGEGKKISVSAEGDIYTITSDLYVYDKTTGSTVLVRFTFVGSLAQPELDLTNAIAITEFKYVARSQELDDNPETSGGDFVYDITCADGKTFRIGLYWSYAEADGSIKNGKYNYCYNALDAMYSGWEGFVIVSGDQYYFGSTLTVEEGKIVLNLVNYEETFGIYVYEG